MEFQAGLNPLDLPGQLRTHLQARLLPLTDVHIEPQRIAQAAVTLILHLPPTEQSRESSALEPQGLLIKRAEHPGDPWSGHLALPGGRAEPDDESLLHTAAREIEEEIGWQFADSAAIIGRLPKITPHHPRLPQIEITPFVAVVHTVPELRYSDEVAIAFWASIPGLQNAGMSAQHQTDTGGQTRSWPAYPSAFGPVWGITGRILNDFLKRYSS